ncbi:DNA-binding transcriptional regulator, GntR family [Sulfobacillus thermosulfidooxidans DSM 9293]|uniref:DNA-binding transcriptional regulator, GntR family n=1 Tax=Sulfobacillus thermosulfidooxidans (strain DSM 9293 / VKM B-1269 / AT-1) TaxID=929705 RepID=A0A1W1WQF4_SULTA|nr:GntR family transcriptional regulator [Sulfobacillus thermosulfidooxidans]SMC08250.1 DNA-binding transcriptional regulator, GntR family [Sulfobacillus thermosulfidooxidans DSM 9293]
MPIPRNLDRLPRLSVRDKVLVQLQQWIIDGTLQPEEKLNDVELADALQVSRTPIREALQILELQGFVELIPGKATRVTPIDSHDVFKIYPPLALLEALNAQDATSRIRPDIIEELKHVNRGLRQALDQRNSWQALEWDRQFHALIAEAADNPYVTSFTTLLHMHASRLKYRFFQHLVLPAYTSVDEHTLIIQALEDKNAEMASAIMKKNWLRPMEELAKSLVTT